MLDQQPRDLGPPNAVQRGMAEAVARVDVRPVLDQQPRDLGPPDAVQRGMAGAVARVDVGPVPQERPHCCGIPLHQHGQPVVPGHVGIGAGGQQRF